LRRFLTCSIDESEARYSHVWAGGPVIFDERLSPRDERHPGRSRSQVEMRDHASRTKSTRTPPVSISAAMARNPYAKLCVASLIAPSRYGPTKPPVLPTELTSAIEPAAATPRIIDVASAQNGPKTAARPIMASDNEATSASGPVPTAASTRPTAPTAAAIAMCHRRSPARSECHPASTTAMAP